VCVCVCVGEFGSLKVSFCLSFSSVTFFFESVMAVTGDLCCEEEKRKIEKHIEFKMKQMIDRLID